MRQRFARRNEMKTQIVTKWGNSLGIRISRAIAQQVNVEEGTPVTLTIVDGSLVIKPEQPKQYTLDELLEGMEPENFHREIDMGQAVGHEIW